MLCNGDLKHVPIAWHSKQDWANLLDNGRSHLHGLPGNFSQKCSKRLTWSRKRSCAIEIALGWIHVAAIIKRKLTANNIVFLRAYVLSMMLSITIYNFARGDWPRQGNCETGELGQEEQKSTPIAHQAMSQLPCVMKRAHVQARCGNNTTVVNATTGLLLCTLRLLLRPWSLSSGAWEYLRYL